MAKEFYLKHHTFHIKAIFVALKDIFEKNEYADKAIQNLLLDSSIPIVSW